MSLAANDGAKIDIRENDLLDINYFEEYSCISHFFEIRNARFAV